jgi:hypothetical protein
MLNFLNHPHIVKLYDSVELSVKEEKFGFLFMENCSSGYGIFQVEQLSAYWKRVKECN